MTGESLYLKNNEQWWFSGVCGWGGGGHFTSLHRFSIFTGIYRRIPLSSVNEKPQTMIQTAMVTSIVNS